MSLARNLTFLVATILLAGGYLASQKAYFDAQDPRFATATAEYTERIDSPSVKVLAMLIVLACIVFAFTNERAEGSE